MLGAGVAGWAVWATIGWAQGQYQLPPEPAAQTKAADSGKMKPGQGTAPALHDKTLPTLPDPIQATSSEKKLPPVDKSAPIASTEENRQGTLVNDDGPGGPGVEPSNTTGRHFGIAFLPSF